LQPELALVLRETTGADTLRYTHSPRGIHAVEDTSGDWHYMAQDGLGSVRTEFDADAQVVAAQDYAPYGLPFNTTGTFVGSFGYAGEQIDDTGLSYNRARYYNPALGAFTGLDPVLGVPGYNPFCSS
jgi:RHS repeat-associated protein